MPQTPPRFARTGMYAMLGASVLASACADDTPPLAPISPRAATATIASGLETFYGPVRFTRGSGSPSVERRVISTAGFEAPFVLHVRNGGVDGSNRVSSGTITLGAREILGQSDFNQQKQEWSIPV